MTERDFDSELKEIKKEIDRIVGKDKIKEINQIINTSYSFDDKPKIELEYNNK